MMVIAEAFSWFQPIYTNVDNYIISMVINRVYAEDTYNMFLNPVLCWITAFVSRIFSNADGFTLVTKLMLLAGIGTISYLIALNFRHWQERLFWAALFLLLIVEMALFSDYFMVWSAFFSFVGMVCLLWVMKTESVHWHWIIVGTLFLCCGLMWRIGGLGLFIPFILLDLGINFLFSTYGKREKEQYLKKGVRVFGLAFVCFLVLLGIDYGYKHSDKYKDSVEFCDAVSKIVDFPVKPYEEVKESLPGITKNDYESLENYLYADTDRITTEYCEKIASAGETKAFHLNVRELLSKTYSLIARFYGLVNFRIWCIALMAAVIFFLYDSAWYQKMELFFSGAGAYLIMMYLMLEGRLPERIMQSILYAVMGIVIILCISEKKDQNKFQIWKKIGALFLTAIVILHLNSTEFVSHQSLWTAQADEKEQKWEKLYGQDAVFVWKSSEYRKYPMRDFMRQGKMISSEFMNHNISAGGWDFNQVYYRELMKRLGVPNPVKSLLEREKTYYIADDCNDMLIYLQEHFDKSVQAVQIDEIEGIPIWKFEVVKPSV